MHGTVSLLGEDYLYTLTSSAAAYDGGGLKIASDIFEAGKRYI